MKKNIPHLIIFGIVIILILLAPYWIQIFGAASSVFMSVRVCFPTPFFTGTLPASSVNAPAEQLTQVTLYAKDIDTLAPNINVEIQPSWLVSSKVDVLQAAAISPNITKIIINITPNVGQAGLFIPANVTIGDNTSSICGNSTFSFIINVTASTRLTFNLTVNKTDSVDPVNSGSSLNYTLAIRNDGSGNLSNITVYESYPNKVTFVSSTPAANASNNTWSLGNLSAGQSTSIYINVNVAADASHNLVMTNRVNVSYRNASNALFTAADEENTTVYNVPFTPSPPSSGGGGGSSCTTTEVCDAACINSQRRCVRDNSCGAAITFYQSCSLPSAAPAGGTCGSSSDCPVGYVCDDSKCVLQPMELIELPTEEKPVSIITYPAPFFKFINPDVVDYPLPGILKALYAKLLVLPDKLDFSLYTLYYEPQQTPLALWLRDKPLWRNATLVFLSLVLLLFISLVIFKARKPEEIPPKKIIAQ